MCFKKLENRHCVDGLHRIIEQNTTLDKALSECAQDKLCDKVYDYLCDNRGQFYLCYNGSPDFYSVRRPRTDLIPQVEKNKKFSSCLFVKETKSGKFLTVVKTFFLFWVIILLRK